MYVFTVFNAKYVNAPCTLLRALMMMHFIRNKVFACLLLLQKRYTVLLSRMGQAHTYQETYYLVLVVYICLSTTWDRSRAITFDNVTKNFLVELEPQKFKKKQKTKKHNAGMNTATFLFRKKTTQTTAPY